MEPLYFFAVVCESRIISKWSFFFKWSIFYLFSVIQDFLHQHQISFIVDCANQFYQLSDPSIEIAHFNVRSHGIQTIKEHFDSINKEIDSFVRGNKNVLIHCYYGMTRSCSCAIAYFIWKNQWSFDQAFELVSSKRRECDIPFDYEEYLREYENQCKGFRNEQIDRIETNCLITVTIPDDQSHEKVIAEVSRFTNKEKDICIMTLYEAINNMYCDIYSYI